MSKDWPYYYKEYPFNPIQQINMYKSDKAKKFSLLGKISLYVPSVIILSLAKLKSSVFTPASLKLILAFLSAPE